MKGKQANPSFISSRFLGIIEEPVSDSNPVELTEADVVWSSDHSSDVTEPASPPLSTTSNSPTFHRQHHSFRLTNFGLSAALSEDHPPLLQRRPSLDPSLSAISAARAIRGVPTHRSSASFDDLSGSGLGRYMQSAPVNIPVWPKRNQRETRNILDPVSDDDDNESDEKMVLPPHEIIARSHTTAFSVFEGAGRTLKGRDLRCVRNTVFQKTGFID